ncbi:HAD family hydrolase [Sphingomonas sp.]|uniref:HAD family hydrolase n=1 Tax=Sphingomonas sp. TaxID=28214 RepID=UPI0017D8DAD9|nr:HAD family hydrolase [Sphingomonas sp.]MBA3510276.1 HAD family hydrolase [Sphingomonas sp.]
MTRPLLITDCDEVLLHMVAHFADWLDQEHDVHFDIESGQFDAMSDRRTGETLPVDVIWPLLDTFFRDHMHRQTLVPGALEALARIGDVADIVVLTNLGDDAHGWRVEQLAGHGIRHEIVCNQGGKGPPVKAIVERRGATDAVFIDDLAVHHSSVARHAPGVWRLHMVAEPRLAAAVPPAEDAHARIDDWPSACEWILDKFQSTKFESKP